MSELGSKETDVFIGSAKTLAKNPLGIIALFIVMVYAVASIVMSLGEAEFYSNPFHPAVLFLAGFPAVVLSAFTYLVACHHEKLYAPSDFLDQRDFVRLKNFPRKLSRSEPGVAVSDKSDQSISADEIESIESRYAQLIEDDLALLHTADVVTRRTSPRSGRYRVRVWVERVSADKRLTDVESVTYHVWNDFDTPVLVTHDASSSFDLWLNIYGEFPVLAVVKLTSGRVIELHRYIDLPGRPPD